MRASHRLFPSDTPTTRDTFIFCWMCLTLHKFLVMVRVRVVGISWEMTVLPHERMDAMLCARM
jgi:hypothetical protein